MNETRELLREFGKTGSDTAFKELVRRYIDLVYSVAVRRVRGDAHRAEDVVQTVFTDLARKAGSLPEEVMLGGWLHRHCCFVASNMMRAEFRRQAREQEAAQMQSLESGYDAAWDEMAPVVDEAIQELEEPDRDALVLRYYERRDLRAVGGVLGISEDAAQKRVSRALEKLRGVLAQRGVAAGGAGLGGLLASHSVVAAPAGWAARASAAALEGAGTKAGLLAGLAALLGTGAGKLAAGIALVLLLCGIAAWKGAPGSAEISPEEGGAPEQMERAASAGGQAAGAAGFVSAEPAAGILPETEEPPLRVSIVAADSGKPVPNIPVEYRQRASGKRSVQNLVSDAFGVLEVSIPRETVERVEITTRLEGFADRRLAWRPENGEEIPGEYTLKVERAVRIGGRIVDDQGQPVTGAKVTLAYQMDAVAALARESHDYGSVGVETDSNGAWGIHRLADEVIRRSAIWVEHPDYPAPAVVLVAREAGAEEALRAGEHVIQFPAAGATVRGFVRDMEGNPVPDARVLLGKRGESKAREAAPALDGSFEFQNVQPGKHLLTAQSDRYAPSTVEFTAGGEAGPVGITLSPGKLLRLRVVNRSGEPVPNAWVRLETMGSPSQAEGKSPPIVQADFSRRSGADGRVAWLNAPDGELMFRVSAKGFMEISDFAVRPDGTEHIVTLLPALKISGTVKDAETGKPVPRFKVIAGRPGEDFPGYKTAPYWSPLERFWLLGSNGQFEHVYEEPVVSGVREIEFIFKVEAEGYAPHITRAVKAEEGSAHFEIELERAAHPVLTVLLPNGEPAARTDVVLAGAGEHLELGSRGFSRNNIEVIHTTDRAGKVSLQPGEHVKMIYAANLYGFAEATPAEVAESGVLRMKEWSRIEGTLARRGKPIAGAGVLWRRWPGKFDPEAPFLHMPRVMTGRNGEFTLPKVPAGGFRLSYSASGNFQDGVAVAGRTIEVHHSEEGVQVGVRFVWPADADRGEDLIKHARIEVPLPVPPAEILSDPAALAAWREAPEIQALIAKHRSWALEEQPDGTWRSGLIPPGTYWLWFSASRREEPGRPNWAAFMAERKVTIPEDYRGESLDLGRVEVERR